MFVWLFILLDIVERMLHTKDVRDVIEVRGTIRVLYCLTSIRATDTISIITLRIVLSAILVLPTLSFKTLKLNELEKKYKKKYIKLLDIKKKLYIFALSI